LTRTNTRSILHHLLSDKHMRAYLLQMAAVADGGGGELAAAGLADAAFNVDAFAGLRPKTRAFRRQLHARVYALACFCITCTNSQSIHRRNAAVAMTTTMMMANMTTETTTTHPCPRQPGLPEPAKATD
jgi:hypothetical protein